MSSLYYTFRTNRHFNEFRKHGIEMFVFGKLKSDLETFFELIHEIKPAHIIGIANVTGETQIESLAINKFGKKGIINKNGLRSYKLHIPEGKKVRVSAKSSSSFCNWTMYNICEFIALNNLVINHSFVHFNEVDIKKVCQLL